MNLKKPFTKNNLSEDAYIILCHMRRNNLYVSNKIGIENASVFYSLGLNFEEIVFYEHLRPICPNCKTEMNENGSRPASPNKLKGFRKEQYICPKCNKTKITSLEPYIKKNCNYSYNILEKGLWYDTIFYTSYGKKSELIKFENNVSIPRSTVYYHEDTYFDIFIERQEEIVRQLLEERGIVPSGYYHYDEQFPQKNGEKLVRLSIIDAVNNLVINEVTMYQEDFDKDVVEQFLKSSLVNLPIEAVITDGSNMYPQIIDKLGAKHQFCVFHIIKTHHKDSFKRINRTMAKIKSIDHKMADNKRKIREREDRIKNGNLSEKQKKTNRKKINSLNDELKNFRKEKRNLKKKLNELLKTNECLENVYDADDKKAAQRRFNTLYNRKDFLDRKSNENLTSLNKKFSRTVTFYDDPLIPRTNNTIERYFGITLPHYLKKKYRTEKGLNRWLRMQRLRWTRRNVLHDYELENISLSEILSET